MTKPNVAAALWLATFANIVMAAMSSAIHEAAAVAPVGQMVFWRSFVALGPILIYLAVRRELGQSLRTRRIHMHLIRGILGCTVMFLSFISLSYLSVGVATAIRYVAPILSICAAVLFLRERPGALVVVCVALGFGGILLMLFPSLAGAEVRDGTLIGIAAGLAMAATGAVSRVQIKDLTRTEPPASIALSFAVFCTVAGLASSLFGWAELDSYTLALLVGAGILGGVGHVLMMEAVARAPVSLLATYEYTGILWAFAFDVLLLGTVLDFYTVSGALVIVMAAAMIAYGQRRESKLVVTPAE